mmetsp:Transcript_60087/g.127299  ORF Transcript_60087/g.127299 Transcript_60087/m.127299 type:complete len:206 (+) Transcript_60087:1336-1953(+)
MRGMMPLDHKNDLKPVWKTLESTTFPPKSFVCTVPAAYPATAIDPPKKLAPTFANATGSILTLLKPSRRGPCATCQEGIESSSACGTGTSVAMTSPSLFPAAGSSPAATASAVEADTASVVPGGAAAIGIGSCAGRDSAEPSCSEGTEEVRGVVSPPRSGRFSDSVEGVWTPESQSQSSEAVALSTPATSLSFSTARLVKTTAIT